MAKDLIVFKDTKKKSKIAKGNIFAKASTGKSKTLLQKVKHIGSKASGEQKFLGKTVLKHPFITAGLALAHAGKKTKWDKRRKWFNTPLAGKDLKKWYL